MLEDPGPWGTGPFVLKSGVSTLEKRSPEVVLEANPNYWNADRKPKVQRVVFNNIMGRDEAIELVSTTQGKVDLVTEITPAEASSVEGSEYAKVVRNDAKTVLVGVFNQNKPNSRWTDIRLRKAVNHAVDRKAVLETGAGGYGTIMPAMIVPGAYGYDSDLKPYDYDPDKAKELLRQAGAEGASITLVAGESYKPLVDVIAQNLQAVGLKVNPVYAAAPEGNDWDIRLVEHFDWSPEFPAGVVFREFFGKDGGYRAMKVDPAFEDMYTKALSITDKDEQGKLVQEMDKYVHEQANVLFLYAPAKLYAVSKRVDFVPFKTTMLDLTETGIKEERIAGR